jgi:undecaprenyl-diphosphatase
LDYNLYKSVNGLSGASFPDSVMTFLANDLAGILVVMVALTFLFPWRSLRQERRNGAVLASAAAGLALLIAQPITDLVDRARPYVSHPAHDHLLIPRSPDPSFPSDHATGAFALAFGIWLYDRTVGTVLLVLAGVLAFARVYVGTHYPGDVVGGALLGISVALALYLITPSRHLLETVAKRCGAIWDRLVARRPSSRSP